MRARLASLPLAAAAGAHLIPSVLTVPPLRARIVPPAAAGRVALTFDDGPHPASTPAFLDELRGLGIRATFFVLGSLLAAHPRLGRRIVDSGHEIAVHGWSHRVHLLRAPESIGPDLRRAVDGIRGVTGVRARFWRPPHGILTGAGLWAAHRLGLRPVLWTVDGRDWRADATASSVSARICRGLADGGVVLLHDTDAESAPGSWRSALHALPEVVAACAERGWTVGPLHEQHGGAYAAG